MQIFFTRKDKLIKHIDDSELLSIHKSEKRNLDSNLGTLITRYVARNVFGEKNTEIFRQNGKPIFKTTQLQFSISHSHNIVGVAFSVNPIGFDIEKIKERDLTKLSKYFKREFNTLTEFYKYWTVYEALYKSKSDLQHSQTSSFKLEDYIISVSAEKITPTTPAIYEITPEPSSTTKLISIKNLNDDNLCKLGLSINKYLNKIELL